MEREPERFSITEPASHAVHLPATSPAWAEYYRRAKKNRRLAHGQHRQIQRETKRRRLRENIVMLGSTAAVGGLMALFYALLTR
jgi:hypothetical protein